MRRNRISGEAYDINKLTIYIAQKSEMESRVESERGSSSVLTHTQMDRLKTYCLWPQ